MFHGDRNFYSSISDSIYEHNVGEYQTYYDIKYDHIVDLIAQQNPILQSTFTNILYNSNAYLYDEDTNQYAAIDSTYDSLIAYNSTQNSGKLALIYTKNSFPLDEDPISAYVKRVDKQFRISNVRDAVVNHNLPIWSSAWNLLYSQPYQWIDKVPNPLNIDNYQSLFESKRFKDHYIGLRFFYNPRNNYKLVTDIVNTQFSNRNR